MNGHRSFGRGLAGGLLIVAACGGDARDWAGTVRDSAGVAIVDNPAAELWTPGTRPTVVEELRIGTATGAPELQFGQISGIDVDSQGRIFVLDQQASRIRVFGPDGAFIKEMGARGSGPGELSQFALGVFLTAGDTLLVADMGQARTTRWAPDGTPLGSVPIDMAQGIPMRWDITPDRRLVQQARTMPLPGAMDVEARDFLLVRGSDGAVRDTLLELPAGQTFQFRQGGASVKLFESEPVWALDSNGHVVFGINSEYRLLVHDGTGQLTRIIQHPFERRPVTDTDKLAFMRFMREMMSQSGAPPAAVDQVLAGVSFADNYPAFASLLGGPAGTIWVQHVRTAEQVVAAGGEFSAQDVGGSDFDVFDADGRFLGTLALPTKFQPVRVRGDRLYGIWRDDLDVQHVMVLRVDGLTPD